MEGKSEGRGKTQKNLTETTGSFQAWMMGMVGGHAICKSAQQRRRTGESRKDEKCLNVLSSRGLCNSSKLQEGTGWRAMILLRFGLQKLKDVGISRSEC